MRDRENSSRSSIKRVSSMPKQAIVSAALVSLIRLDWTLAIRHQTSTGHGVEWLRSGGRIFYIEPFVLVSFNVGTGDRQTIIPPARRLLLPLSWLVCGIKSSPTAGWRGQDKVHTFLQSAKPRDPCSVGVGCWIQPRVFTRDQTWRGWEKAKMANRDVSIECEWNKLKNLMPGVEKK